MILRTLSSRAMLDELMNLTAAKSSTASLGDWASDCSSDSRSSVNCGSSARWTTTTVSDHFSTGIVSFSTVKGAGRR